MIYNVPKQDITILTHTFNPLMQTNGFKQLGDFVPVDSIPSSDLSDLGLGSWFSKKVVGTVKSAIKKPLPAIATLTGKIATGGVTLITETGVLGKSAKKGGKKAEVMGASTISGAAAGFVMSGFNPVGAVAGGAAGLAKGIAESTKTSKQGDIGKAFYQSAAWGAGAGIAVGGTTALLNAKAASAAKAANIAQFAGQSGYIVPAKVAGASFLTKAAVGSLLLQNLLPKQPAPPSDGGYTPADGGGTSIVIQTPGGYSSDGYSPGGYSGGGGSGGMGPDATVPFADGSTGAPSGMGTATKVALAGAGLLLLMRIGKRKAA